MVSIRKLKIRISIHGAFASFRNYACFFNVHELSFYYEWIRKSINFSPCRRLKQSYYIPLQIKNWQSIKGLIGSRNTKTLAKIA